MATENHYLRMDTKCDVLIIGAGPVGALAGYLLAQRGLKVILTDKGSKVIASPRALVYHPQVNYVLEKAGLLDDVREAGVLVEEGLVWRWTSDHSPAVTIDHDALEPDDKPQGKARQMILLGQHVFTSMVLEKFKWKGGSVLWERAFKAFDQRDGEVRSLVTDAEGEDTIITSKFLIGCDGGHSLVRKAIGQHLDGFTHDIPLIAVNLKYPDIKATGFTNMQFLMDPQEKPEDSNWSIIIHTGTEDIWRCAYGDSSAFSDDELKARVPMKLKEILPLHPDPDKYEVLLAQPYRVHQRCVGSMVKGRVLLAGDAAHLNNPAGGIGMNTGLLDSAVAVDAICDAINLIDETKVDERLKEYSDLRRKAFLEHTNPVTTAHLRRLIEKSDDADSKRKEYLENLKDNDFLRKLQLGQNHMALGVPGLA